MTPHLKVSIVRTGTIAQPWVMDTINNAVAMVEGVLGAPLPVSHVVAVISDASFCGCTTGFAFDVPLYMHQGKDTNEGQRLQVHVVHELAHYYWANVDRWVNEGISRSFESLYAMEYGLSPRAYRNPRWNCEAHDLQMHMEWEARYVPDEFRCRHYLGGKLFRELLEVLGTEEFETRLKELYLLQIEELEKRGDRNLGIAEVRRVFSDHSEIVEKHWSGKLNAPENRLWDEDIYYYSHDLIRWDQHPTYDGDSVTFSGTLLGDSVLWGETIAQARRGGYGNFHIFSVDGLDFTGNIFPPGWNHPPRFSGDNVALEYRLEGRTFAIKFPFPKDLGNPSDYFVDVWGFKDKSRTPLIAGYPLSDHEVDWLGYARIRTD